MTENTPTPAAPSTPATPATPTLTAPPAPPVGPQAEITSAQAEIMIGWEKDNLAKGRITLEEANKRFDALGATAEQRALDTRTVAEKELDAAFPVAKPSDYKIAYGLPGQDVPTTPELTQFDTNARGWMAGAGLPRDLGNSLVTQITRVLQTTKGMTPDQLESYGTSEFAKLERAHGPALDDKLRAAGRMVEDLERTQPGLKQLLKSHGIGDSAMVANMLIQHATIYHARKGR
jgi:hypothetical protein